MTKKDNSTHPNVFTVSETVKIGRSSYIIERHFSGERDIREAVFSAVQNEAKRNNKS